MTSATSPIYLAWARTPKDCGYLNFGDALSPIIVSMLSGRKVLPASFESLTPRLTGIGTILHGIKGGGVSVWGTGLDASRNFEWAGAHGITQDTKMQIAAVRGRFTRMILESQGVECPGVYGDPGYLISRLFKREVKKKWDLGVILHISEVSEPGLNAASKPEYLRYRIPAEFSERVKIIHTYCEGGMDGMRKKIDEIRSCRQILTTSLHGAVIAEAYKIPAAHFKFSGEGIRKIPIYPYGEAIDHRFRDFYSAQVGRDHVLCVGQERSLSFDFSTVVDGQIERQWEPFEFDDQSLIRAFPFLDSEFFHKTPMQLMENIQI